MIEKVLLIIQRLKASLPGKSPGKASRQQKITVVGSNNNITIINGNINNSNLILPKDQNNVKRFTSKNCKK